jgi:transcriptional regulator with XRE-family HTH domain
MKIKQNVATPQPLLESLKNMGLHLSKMRKSRHLLQAEAAARANISRETASRIENGDSSVGIGQIIRYLNAIAPGAELCNLYKTEDAALKMMTFKNRTARVRKLKENQKARDKYDF